MWSVLETIENGMVCVAASPAVWVVDDHILHWPPGIANRGVISDPQPDWTRHMCRVLRTNIETFEEALKAEKMYSKHRDSNSFREEEASKKLKREHPINSNLSDLIDVNALAAKIDDDAGIERVPPKITFPLNQVSGKSKYHKECMDGRKVTSKSSKTSLYEVTFLPKMIFIASHDGKVTKNARPSIIANIKKRVEITTKPKVPRYDNFLKSGKRSMFSSKSALPALNLFTKPLVTKNGKKSAAPSATITKSEYLQQITQSKFNHVNQKADDEQLPISRGEAQDFSSIAMKDGTDLLHNEGEEYNHVAPPATATIENNILILENITDECHSDIETDVNLYRGNANTLSSKKVNVLENVLIEPASTIISFEEAVLSELKELRKSQKESDERLRFFEERVEAKCNAIVSAMQMQGRNRNVGQRQERQEPVPPTPSMSPAAAFDYEDFEEFDEHFPVQSDRNVDELEWNIRKDLTFRFRLLTRINELGGENVKKCIRLKMKYLISDRALEHYTWRGTAEKKSFKQLQSLNDLIFRSVREQFQHCKRVDFSSYMVQWLKHARTRQRTVSYIYPDRKAAKNLFGTDEDYDDDVDYYGENGEDY